MPECRDRGADVRYPTVGLIPQAVQPKGLAAFAAVLVLLTSPLRAEPATEVRALWVVRTTLTSPAAIATMVSSAKAGGFNTLLVQVRGRGDAYFQRGVEPRPPSLDAQPEFDPLATTIARARDAGLKVHAWINVNLVAGTGELPSARSHVVFRHPEWLMVPRALAAELAGTDPRSPGYLGRLARFVRGQSHEIEGLYLSPVSPSAAAYTTSIVRDIADRYDLDGIHLDYIRYPREDFDYSSGTLTAFRAALADELREADRRRYDARAASGEPLIYTQVFPQRWKAFRTERLTALLSAIRQAVKLIKPSALVSVAVVPDAEEAAERRLQDWRGWVDTGLVDVICPMAYTADPAVFAAQIAGAREIAGARPLWAGIGAYRLSPAQIAENVQTARRLGVRGVILFSYDSLADPAHGPGYLSQVGRAALTRSQ
jgi:uncharacterized lipoprotein YddW (UPF0748 family)